jgi:hypothetical protein
LTKEDIHKHFTFCLDVIGEQQELESVSSEDNTFTPGKPTSDSQSFAQQAGALISQTG